MFFFSSSTNWKNPSSKANLVPWSLKNGPFLLVVGFGWVHKGILSFFFVPKLLFKCSFLVLGQIGRIQVKKANFGSMVDKKRSRVPIGCWVSLEFSKRFLDFFVPKLQKKNSVP